MIKGSYLCLTLLTVYKSVAVPSIGFLTSGEQQTMSFRGLMVFEEDHIFSIMMILITLGGSSVPIQTGLSMKFWDYSRQTGSFQHITQQFIENFREPGFLSKSSRRFPLKGMKIFALILFAIWLSIHQNNLAFWMKFQRTRELSFALRADQGRELKQ